MSNREVSFVSDGVTYTMRFTTNALYRLEEKLGRSFPRLAVDLQTNNAGFRELQTMLWAGLEGQRMKSKENRPVYTLEEVGDIIDGAGGLTTLAGSITDAFNRAFPQPVLGDGGEGGATNTDPTK